MPLSPNDRRRWMRRVQRDQRVVLQTRAPHIRQLFREMATAVAAEYRRNPTLAAAFRIAQSGYDIPMAQLFSTIWIESGLAAGQQISDFVNAPINPDSRDFLRRMGARRVTRVRRQTREGIRRSIEIGQQAGLTPRAIATGQGEKARILAQETSWRPLRQVVAQTYRNRDLTIVRTETALAHQAAAAHNYEYHDINRVEILDSPDCGLLGHTITASNPRADGMIVALAFARRYPLSHPNCVRASAPVVDFMRENFRRYWLIPDVGEPMEYWRAAA